MEVQSSSEGEYLCKINAKLCLWLIQSFLNASVFAIEVVCAVYLHSAVIEADGVMHLHDAIVVLVSLASKLIGGAKTTRNTFGWVRVESMGELVASVFVLSLSCGLLPHVLRMMVSGEKVQHLSVMFYVLSLSLAVRISGLILTFETHFKHMSTRNMRPGAEVKSRPCRQVTISGTEMTSLNPPYVPVPLTSESSGLVLENNAGMKLSIPRCILHLQAHFCSTIFGFLVLFVLVEAQRSSFTVADIPTSTLTQGLEQSVGILVTLINCVRVTPILINISMTFMQGVPSKIDIKFLRKRLENIKHVSDIHELHVWKLKDPQVLCHLHVRMRNINHFQTIEKKIKQILVEFKIQICTIQPEVEGVNFSARRPGQCLLDCPAENIETCRDRQCCGGRVDPYIDIAAFRRRSESICAVEQHFLKHLPSRIGSPNCSHQHHHHHQHASQSPVLRKLRSQRSLTASQDGSVIENKHHDSKQCCSHDHHHLHQKKNVLENAQYDLKQQSSGCEALGKSHSHKVNHEDHRHRLDCDPDHNISIQSSSSHVEFKGLIEFKGHRDSIESDIKPFESIKSRDRNGAEDKRDDQFPKTSCYPSSLIGPQNEEPKTTEPKTRLGSRAGAETGDTKEVISKKVKIGGEEALIEIHPLPPEKSCDKGSQFDHPRFSGDFDGYQADITPFYSFTDDNETSE